METVCDVCYEKPSVLKCSCGTHGCSDCLSSFLQNEPYEVVNDGGIHCMNRQCDVVHTIYTVSRLPEEDFDKIMTVLNAKRKQKIEHDIINEQKKMKEVEEKMALYNEIVDMMTPKCPACKKGFVDFDGCFSIHCSCQKYFCAWCLEVSTDSSERTHEHVRFCESNVHHRGNYFGTKEEFDKSFSNKLCNDFAALDLDKYTDVLLRAEPQLKLHGLNITEYGTITFVEPPPQQHNDYHPDVLRYQQRPVDPDRDRIRIQNREDRERRLREENEQRQMLNRFRREERDARRREREQRNQEKIELQRRKVLAMRQNDGKAVRMCSNCREYVTHNRLTCPARV